MGAGQYMFIYLNKCILINVFIINVACIWINFYNKMYFGEKIVPNIIKFFGFYLYELKKKKFWYMFLTFF